MGSGGEIHQFRLRMGRDRPFGVPDDLREVEGNVALAQVHRHRPGRRGDLRGHIPAVDTRVQGTGRDIVGEILLSKSGGVPARVDEFLRARQGCRVGGGLQPGIVLVAGAQVEHERSYDEQSHHEDRDDDRYRAGLLAQQALRARNVWPAYSRRITTVAFMPSVGPIRMIRGRGVRKR